MPKRALAINNYLFNQSYFKKPIRGKRFFQTYMIISKSDTKTQKGAVLSKNLTFYTFN